MCARLFNSKEYKRDSGKTEGSANSVKGGGNGGSIVMGAEPIGILKNTSKYITIYCDVF